MSEASSRPSSPINPSKQPRPAVRQTQTVTRSTSSSSSSSSSSTESVSDEDVQIEVDEDEVMDEDDLRAGGSDDEMPWPQQLNLESQRVHVMQTSLFRMPELAKSSLEGHTSYLKHPRPIEVNFDAKKAPARTSFTQPRTHPPPHKYVRVASQESVSASYEGSYLDAGLSFGRSFRVGWGPGNKIAHVGNISSSSASYVKSSAF